MGEVQTGMGLLYVIMSDAQGSWVTLDPASVPKGQQCLCPL